MHPPAGTSERPAQVHRRPIGGKKAWNDERRRPVLRPARTQRTQARKVSRKVPGDFTQAVPARRCEVVRVNRAGISGDGSSTFHALKMGALRYRNNNFANYACDSRNLSISRTTRSAARRETAKAI